MSEIRMHYDRRITRWLGLVFAVLIALSGQSPGLRGESTIPARKPTPAVERPLFVLNAASVERVLASSDRLFKLLERSDLSLAMRGTISVSTNGLKGIDRKRPFGVMTYINPGPAPEPVGILYVPITSAKSFRESLALAKFTLKPIPGLAGGFLVKSHDRNFALRIRGQYAFLAHSRISLQRHLPAPAKQFASLARDADVALFLQINAIPKGMKTMVLDYVRAATELRSAKRTNESTHGHRVRNAVGSSLLTGFEEFLHDGESLTIGMKFPSTSRSVAVRLHFVARAKTRLATGLKQIAATRKPISRKTVPDSQFRLTANWKPAESQQGVFKSVSEAIMKSHNGNNGRNPTDTEKVNSAWESLRRFLFSSGLQLATWTSATKSEGTRPTAPATFARMSFPDAKSADKQVRNALFALKAAGLVADSQLNFAKQGAARFHRFSWNRRATTNASDFRGEKCIVAVRNKTAWFAIGSGSLLRLLQQEMRSKALSNRRPVSKQIAPLPCEILRVAVRWSVLVSSFGGRPAPSRRSQPMSSGSRFLMRVVQSGNSLTIQTGFPAAAIRRFTTPYLKRLYPR